jgi:ribosome-binding protein aMBF1 (putative translation factor)
MQPLTTYPELAAMLTKELGEPITQKRIENAIRKTRITPQRKKPGRGTVGGRSSRAVTEDDIAIIRKYFVDNRVVSKDDARWIIVSLKRSGMSELDIAEWLWKDESTINKWMHGKRYMKQEYFERLEDRLCRLLEGRTK